ncbi:MAG TPA: ABC transporter permease [Acidobacteriota bacterium]|nr:ABC transporter permease [Acidobacteriota bacterium]
MNPRTIWIVFRKEVLDIIRDRRAVAFMIIMPLVLIPALMYLISTFALSSEKGIAERESTVAVVGAEDAPGLLAYLRNEERQRFNPPGESELDIFVIEDQSGVNAFIEVLDNLPASAEAGEIRSLIDSKQLDAVLVVPPDFQSQLESHDEGLNLRIDFLSTSDRSEKAYQRLRRSLSAYRERVVESRLTAASLNAKIIEPFETAGQDMATGQERAGEIFGRILPYMIILMTFNGAMFPAINMAAGEKEQKTLETLLASPASRIELVTGKFVVIMLTGVISSVLSLVGMYYGLSMGEIGARLRQVMTLSIDTSTIVMAVLLVVPLAFVFAGVLLTISVFARSYREAQGYMGPLTILIILPAFASFLPGVELNYTLSMVPVVNVSLVLKKVLAGQGFEVMHYYALTFVSTLVIAGIAIWLCARMFKNENAIFKV